MLSNVANYYIDDVILVMQISIRTIKYNSLKHCFLSTFDELVFFFRYNHISCSVYQREMLVDRTLWSDKHHLLFLCF
jgi:hypothetical protein